MAGRGVKEGGGVTMKHNLSHLSWPLKARVKEEGAPPDPFSWGRGGGGTLCYRKVPTAVLQIAL